MRSLTIHDLFLFGEWFDIFWFHGCYLTGVTVTLKERLGYHLTQVVGVQEGNILHFYFSRGEWTDIGKRYLAEVLKDQEKLKIVLDDIRHAADEMIVFCDELRKRDLGNLKKEEEIDLYRRYHGKQHALWTLGMIPNVLELENYFLTDYLKDWLKKQALSGQEQIDAFQALVTPRELSMAQKEERAMLELAMEEHPGQKLEDHWRAYSWLQFGWTGPSLTLEYFTDVHHRLHAEGKSEEQLKTVLNEDRQLVDDKEMWLKRLAIPKDISQLFRLMEELLYMKTYRMDALYISYEAIQPLLKAIAKRYYVSLQQVYAMYADWLIPMLEENNVDVRKINEIAKYSVRYYDGEQIYLLVGEEAQKLISEVKEKLPPVAAVTELKGECAFPGVVLGIVRIINRADEMKKFHDGEILVSNVTDPSLLPVMKKATAFVTNMGGLTCHAAIVARELHTPCVVGTKIATHVFKDGDKVEVDAAKGIVRKMEH